MALKMLDPAGSRLAIFRPPYDAFVSIDLCWRPERTPPAGSAVVWWLTDAREQEDEFQWLHSRPAGLPLVLILPPANRIDRTLPLLNYVTTLEPRAVLPTGRLATPVRVRQLLATAPQPLPPVVVSYPARRGLLTTEDIRDEVQRIFEAAPTITSVSRLARAMCTSRRTLGRHFSKAGLPVPSHWLQFARLLYVATELQTQKKSVARIASRAKYPDGFTLSNQMKRLLGYRPTDVRRLLGWEWLVEAWIFREVQDRRIDLERYGDAICRYCDADRRDEH